MFHTNPRPFLRWVINPLFSLRHAIGSHILPGRYRKTDRKLFQRGPCVSYMISRQLRCRYKKCVHGQVRVNLDPVTVSFLFIAGFQWYVSDFPPEIKRREPEPDEIPTIVGIQHRKSCFGESRRRSHLEADPIGMRAEDFPRMRKSGTELPRAATTWT